MDTHFNNINEEGIYTSGYPESYFRHLLTKISVLTSATFPVGEELDRVVGIRPINAK
jgi:hypothetical protein